MISVGRRNSFFASDHLVAALTLATLAIMLIGLGCAGSRGRGRGTHAGKESPQVSEKMLAEAYSFQARLHSAGKPVSFRLEIYQTDSLLGLSGRGYLGKGALKGRLTSDSIEVYFPSTKEYLYEALADLISGSECPLPLARLDVISLFYNLADSVKFSQDIRVVANHKDAKRPEYIIYADGCAWQLELRYDKRKTGWRIRDFTFTDGKDIRLSGRRSKYKAKANIKRKRFEVVLPSDAVRIRP